MDNKFIIIKSYREIGKSLGDNDIPHATSHDVHHQHDNHHQQQQHGQHVHGDHTHCPYVKRKSNGVFGMYVDGPSSHYKCTSVSSPDSVLSLQSNGSSSSLFSNGNSLSDNGSPTPPSLEELKSQMACGTPHYPNGSCLDPKLTDSPHRNRRNTNGRLIDELGLCRNLSKMYVSDEQQDSSSFRDFSVDRGGIRFGDGSLNGNNQSNADDYAFYRNFSGAFSDNVGIQSSVPRNAASFEGQMSSSVLGLQQGHRMRNMRSSLLPTGEPGSLFSEFNGCNHPMSSPRQQGHRMGNLWSSHLSSGEQNSLFSEFNGCNHPMSSPREKIKEQTSHYCQIGSRVLRSANTSGRMSPADSSFYLQPNGMNSQLSSGENSSLFSEFNGYNHPMTSSRQKINEQTSNYYQTGSPVSSRATNFSRMSPADSSFYLQPNGMNSIKDSVWLNSLNSPQVTQTTPPHLNVDSLVYGQPMTDGRTGASPNIRIGGLEAFTSEDSFIIQGEGLNYVVNMGLDRARGHTRSALRHIGARLERSQEDGRHQNAEVYENSQNSSVFSPFSLPLEYKSLAEVQGYMGMRAKDQNGCRFLQKMLLEGTAEDVQTIFDEIIEHVVELMMNPFGNYLMQKMLDVCNEEQRMQILVMVTAQPMELVKISLNSHGTRVVQKLIETLKTRQQISLLIAALKPGFLALIKDPNGNHVIQRCLQYFSNEDNKFIFAAAARYCVDIATHQHGCCVLQRCISHSTGEHRKNLVTEISANALLLAKDNYGNYVVQFILDLKIPSATSNVVSQLEGHYVHLSMQKFGSHVVEKCLMVFDYENQARIIHELLAASHFEQLLQDPHANYVIQTALRVSEGTVGKLLVEAVVPHKSLVRNSPYSKKIFSSKLLKK